MTNEQIIAAGQQIYDETEVGANTSERIGGVIKGIGQRLATRDTEVEEALSQLANQNAGVDAKNGYYTNSQAANESALTVTAPGYVLSAGGNIRIKMEHATTASSVTLNINGTGAKALYYNGEPVSPENTWEDEETIVVYYDGGKYLATNSLGGGGKSSEVTSDEVVVTQLDDTLTEILVGEEVKPDEEQTTAECTEFERTNGFTIGSDGKAYQAASYKAVSEFIPISQNTPYQCFSSSWSMDANIGLAFYSEADEDSYIEGSFRNDTIHTPANVSGTVPSGAKYIRVTWPSGSQFVVSQNKLIYYKPTKEYYSKIERAGSFKTGEKVSDVEIANNLQKDSEGLIKSGAVYEVTHAQIINRYDTPLLTGTIATSYKGYTISAGKTVYDADLNIVKLIFNENIKESATDITVTYYIADPDASALGTSHTATIVAGTNYAVVDFVLPAGKLIYVTNKDVFASGDNYPSGCLIAGNRSSGSEQSYYVLGSTHGNIYAGFSYEYSRSVELKEYVDIQNEETSDKIEELSKNLVTWKDAKTVVVFGSSLTDQRFAPAGHIWLEEINHICNVNLINYALSGEALQGANLRWAKELDFSPTWILWNNEANGTPYGLAGYKLLCAAMEITQSKGAVMMLGGENHTANEDNYPLKRVDKLFDVFAGEHHLCRSELRRERVISLVGQTYPRFDSGIHYGWRNQAPFITKHLELLGNLPVSKSVKIYKLRPNSVNLQVSALSYDTPFQRMKHFYALSTGVAYNGLYTTSQFDVVDNIKQGQNDNPQPYYANALQPVEIIKTRETEALLKGNDITIPNGKAVVEFTLEHIDVKSGIFKFKTSANSLLIYVAIAYNSSTTYDDNPRSTWQSVNDVTISPDDNSGYIVTANVAGVIELYDNVKFLVAASGEFTIKQPEFEYKGGMKKNTPVLNYKPRKYGVEVNDNLHVDENDWTLTGNADIKQVPSTIGLYGADTYHIELSSQGDSASKTVTIPSGTKKVAIRVMSQRFIPIMTKLFVGTPDANSPYVSETQVINNYDCDLGVVDITINDAAVSRHVLCPGFAWNYVEFAPDLTDTSLKIEVRKPDGDTAPIMVYMLSVQVIE